MMKAFVNKTYGSPNVLQLEDVVRPTPKKNEILIQVTSISINPSEAHSLAGKIWVVRLACGLRHPKNTILGADVAGYVVEVGEEVTSFQKGDRVIGRASTHGLTELCCLEVSKATRLPQNLSLQTAAAFPLAAVTALIALRDKGQLKRGQHVLINGASGGIGTFAVQLAIGMGAEVTGVCSSKNHSLVKSLGAHHVIDYCQEDFTTVEERYDLLIDLVGNRTINELKTIIKPKGICVMVGYTNFQNMLSYIWRGFWYSKFTTQKFVTMNTDVQSTDLAYICEMASQGSLRPVIESTVDFEHIPLLFKLINTKHTMGKLVATLIK